MFRTALVFLGLVALQSPATVLSADNKKLEESIVKNGHYESCESFNHFQAYRHYLKMMMPSKTPETQLDQLSLKLSQNCQNSIESFKQFMGNLQKWQFPFPTVLTFALNISSQQPLNLNPLIVATQQPLPSELRKLSTAQFMSLLQYLATHKATLPADMYQSFFSETSLIIEDCRNYLGKDTKTSCPQLASDIINRFHWYRGEKISEAIKKVRDEILKVPGVQVYSPHEIYSLCYSVSRWGPSAVRNYVKALQFRRDSFNSLEKKDIEKELNVALEIAKSSFKININ